MKIGHILISAILIQDAAPLLHAEKPSGGVKGRVIDSRKRSALAGAVIAVRTERDSVFKVTDTKGAFTITGLPRGNARLRISFIGYRPA